MATFNSSVNNFFISSSWTGFREGTSNVYSTASTGATDKTFDLSGVPAGAIIDSAILTSVLGSPSTGIDDCLVRYNSVDYNFSSGSLDVTAFLQALGGVYSSIISRYKFKANGNSGATSINGIPHSASLNFNDNTLAITYHMPVSGFSLSTASLDAGQTITVNISRAEASYTHTVIFTFGAETQTFTGVATSQAFAIPLAWMNQIPNSISGTASCIVRTYNSIGTYMGEPAAQTFTITAPASVKPTLTSVTAALVDGYWGLYVQGYSRVQLTANGATGAYGSTITGFSIAGGTSNPFTTGVLNTAGSNTFYATVTDSRNRTSDAVSVSITVTAYNIPAVSGVLVQRATNGTGTLGDEGTYCKVTPTYAWSAIGSNARTTAVDYKETTSGAWIAGSTALIASGGYVVLGSGATFAIDKSCDIRFTVDDSISGPVFAYVTLQTAKYIMDFKAGGGGVCFGGVSTLSNTVEIAPDWKLHAKRGVFTSTNDVTLGTSGETTGVALITGDVAGSHIEYDNNEIMAKVGNTAAQLFLNNEGGAVNIGVGGLAIAGGLSIAGVAILDFIRNAFYPIGSIYMSISATNPATTMGGTWVAWGAGRVPVGVYAGDADFNAAEKYGGEKAHTLTTAEVPAHSHGTVNNFLDKASMSGSTTNRYVVCAGGGANPNFQITDTVGGGGAHNNMPPYLTCYMWKRTA